MQSPESVVKQKIECGNPVRCVYGQPKKIEKDTKTKWGKEMCLSLMQMSKANDERIVYKMQVTRLRSELYLGPLQFLERVVKQIELVEIHERRRR
jgi:hypothetical protein